MHPFSKSDPVCGRVLSSGSMSVSGPDAGVHQPDSVINTVVPTNGNRARTVLVDSASPQARPLEPCTVTLSSRCATPCRRSAAPPTESYSQANAFEALALEKQSLELHAEKIWLAQALERSRGAGARARRRHAKGGWGQHRWPHQIPRGSPSVRLDEMSSEDAILRVQRGPGHWPMRMRPRICYPAAPRRVSTVSPDTWVVTARWFWKPPRFEPHARCSNDKFGSPVSPHSLSRASSPAMADSYGAHAETRGCQWAWSRRPRDCPRAVRVVDGSTGMIPAPRQSLHFCCYLDSRSRAQEDQIACLSSCICSLVHLQKHRFGRQFAKALDSTPFCMIFCDECVVACMSPSSRPKPGTVVALHTCRTACVLHLRTDALVGTLF